MLVDSHCHLDRLDLSAYDSNLDKAIDAARRRGVSRMLCVCISAENRIDVLNIAKSYDFIYASAGIHPCDVKHELVDVESLKSWVQDSKVVALGESGLDYYYSKDFKEQQKQSFANHLIAAADVNLPVIVHTRDARKDTLELIREYGNLESAGVLHCFTEDWEMASKAMDLNYYISISGIVTFKNASTLRDVVKRVPIDRLLVETDSPYLAPMPYRGKPNEPQYVREVAEFVADLKGVSYETLCEQTSDNFFRLFSKAEK